MATINSNPRSFQPNYDGITMEDFETASMISAAPSYISDVPSYHSQTIPNEPAPPYSPRQNNAPSQGPHQNPAAQLPSRSSGPVFVPPPPGLMVHTRGASETSIIAPSSAARQGNSDNDPHHPPRISPVRRVGPSTASRVPSLSNFRIPTLAANPSARHYVRVAQRRAQAAAAAADAGLAMRMLLDRVEEEGAASRFRPLEDPYLVGEDEARRARERRLARNGDDGGETMEHESRRWDWFLNQTREWDGRDRRANSPGSIISGTRRERKPRGRLSLFARR